MTNIENITESLGSDIIKQKWEIEDTWEFMWPIPKRFNEYNQGVFNYNAT